MLFQLWADGKDIDLLVEALTATAKVSVGELDGLTLIIGDTTVEVKLDENGKFSYTLDKNPTAQIIDDSETGGDTIQLTADSAALSGTTVNENLQKLDTGGGARYLKVVKKDDEDGDSNSISDEIIGDQTYNFGFAGTHPVSITLGNAAEGTKAIFKGDGQYYAPFKEPTEGDRAGIELEGVITLVEFAGNNSLFPFTQTYGKGTFGASDHSGELSNILPAGKTATFKEGFTLGAGHTLIVKGTLIG